MDSAELLDLLGNENRRRILRLLSRRPCYVTEIGEFLDVSPKAVIDHLQKLEEAGLVESQSNGSRRKYFHIAQDVRLEVNVSRHGFGTKSAYPANPGMDLTGRCRHVRLELDADEEPASVELGRDDDVARLASEYDRLKELENELSLAQRWVRGQLSAVLDGLADRLGTDGDARLFAEVLAAVAETDGSPAAVAREVDAPRPEVESVLRQLGEVGVLRRTADAWEFD